MSHHPPGASAHWGVPRPPQTSPNWVYSSVQCPVPPRATLPKLQPPGYWGALTPPQALPRRGDPGIRAGAGTEGASPPLKGAHRGTPHHLRAGGCAEFSAWAHVPPQSAAGTAAGSVSPHVPTLASPGLCPPFPDESLSGSPGGGSGGVVMSGAGRRRGSPQTAAAAPAPGGGAGCSRGWDAG